LIVRFIDRAGVVTGTAQDGDGILGGALGYGMFVDHGRTHAP
jgi:hypothetical protein